MPLPAQSFSSALANVLLTALAVWIPLAPLLFLLHRMMEDRNMSGWVVAGAAVCG